MIFKSKHFQHHNSSHELFSVHGLGSRRIWSPFWSGSSATPITSVSFFALDKPQIVASLSFVQYLKLLTLADIANGNVFRVQLNFIRERVSTLNYLNLD